MVHRSGPFCVVGGKFISWSWEHGWPAALHSRRVWGMLPQEVLGILRHLLMHAEPCRNTHRASWEDHWAAHYHRCLLSYWNWKLSPPRAYTAEFMQYIIDDWSCDNMPGHVIACIISLCMPSQQLAINWKQSMLEFSGYLACKTSEQ